VTTYIILKADENGDWGAIATGIKASSARRALTAEAVGEGTYVAVPTRSWKPLTVKVENTVKVTIS
jgi:hypothetical protein